MDLPPRDIRSETKRGFVGNTTPGPAGLEPHVSINTSVRDVGDPTRGQDVLNKERVDREKLQTKGRTPVRVKKMRLFLGRYPDRKAAQLLEEGFSVGFRIPCTLLVIPPRVAEFKVSFATPEGSFGETAEGGCIGPDGRSVYGGTIGQYGGVTSGGGPKKGARKI